MVFGRSGGVRGHGMDNTNRFPRTLAGFSLTWHGGNRFSCFLEILETHFITKYLQIGPRIVLKARVPSQELSNKCIFQNMTPGNIFRETVNHPQIVIFDKTAFFCMHFFWPHAFLYMTRVKNKLPLRLHRAQLLLWWHKSRLKLRWLYASMPRI